MNKNLQRLNELVMETNKVIENLKQDTEEIKEDNTARRIEKYKEIYKTIMDCKEIADKLLPYRIRVKVKGTMQHCTNSPNFDDLYVGFNDVKNTDNNVPCMRDSYDISNGYDCFEEMKTDKYKPNCYYNKYYVTLIDNWDREDFEMKFMAEVERVIKEKVEKANKAYSKEANSQEKLKGEEK